MLDAAKKRREEARKRRELVNGIIDFMRPDIEDMKLWEIRSLIDEIENNIVFKFQPFRTFGQAINWKGK